MTMATIDYWCSRCGANPGDPCRNTVTLVPTPRIYCATRNRDHVSWNNEAKKALEVQLGYRWSPGGPWVPLSDLPEEVKKDEDLNAGKVIWFDGDLYSLAPQSLEGMNLGDEALKVKGPISDGWTSYKWNGKAEPIGTALEPAEPGDIIAARFWSPIIVNPDGTEERPKKLFKVKEFVESVGPSMTQQVAKATISDMAKRIREQLEKDSIKMILGGASHIEWPETTKEFWSTRHPQILKPWPASLLTSPPSDPKDGQILAYKDGKPQWVTPKLPPKKDNSPELLKEIGRLEARVESELGWTEHYRSLVAELEQQVEFLNAGLDKAREGGVTKVVTKEARSKATAPLVFLLLVSIVFAIWSTTL